MSVRVMADVWSLDLPQAEKFVLLALADHADHLGNNVRPSVALVAWKTGYSERQVQRIYRSLERRGILVAKSTKTGGRAKATRYAIAIAKGDKLSPFRPTERICDRKGDICDTKG